MVRVRAPRYSNESIEYPTDGYDRGDYVAFKAGAASLISRYL